MTTTMTMPTTRGRILLADDEATFLNSTADLLRREGFECETVSDGFAALARVDETGFDLVISDLEMPGNEDLVLVRQLAERAGGLPIIIVTGYPSARSAIAAIELPVSAYLVKPVAFAELLARVETATARFRSYTAMRRVEERLRDWGREFETVTAASDVHGAPQPPVDAFLSLALRNVMGSLSDLEQVSRALSGRAATAQPCEIVNCPRGLQLRAAVEETIRVLEATKGAFRSRTLARLREQLELLLATN